MFLSNPKFKKIVASCVLSSACLFALSNSAFAQSVQPEPGTNSIVVQNSDSSIVIIPSNEVSKEDWNPDSDLQTIAPKLEEKNNSNSIASAKAATMYYKHLQSRGWDPQQFLKIVIDTQVYYSGVQSVDFHGKTTSQWMGNPTYANSIKLNETFKVSGIGVNAVVPGGFAVDKDTATFTQTINNTWAATHSFSGVKFNGLSIFTVSHTASASALVGISTYTASTTDSAII